MKLVRWGEAGSEKPGLVDEAGAVRDCSQVLEDFGPDSLAPSRLHELASIDVGTLPEVEADMRLGPPVANVGKIVCVGLNYADHAAESGMELPAEPVLFGKATSAICGPDDDVVIPAGGTKVDWEVELGVVIGTRAKHVLPEAAMEHIAGYTIVNDVSERAFQLEGTGQWLKGKSCDTFAPLGPWLVTRDEIDNPHELDIWLEIDGRRMQNGNTRTMVFDIPTLVSYISRFMTLLPGDIISTGTPPGVGLGMDPPRYLKPGERMHLGIAGLGEQTQRVVV